MILRLVIVKPTAVPPLVTGKAGSPRGEGVRSGEVGDVELGRRAAGDVVRDVAHVVGGGACHPAHCYARQRGGGERERFRICFLHDYPPERYVDCFLCASDGSGGGNSAAPWIAGSIGRARCCCRSGQTREPLPRRRMKPRPARPAPRIASVPGSGTVEVRVDRVVGRELAGRRDGVQFRDGIRTGPR